MYGKITSENSLLMQENILRPVEIFSGAPRSHHEISPSTWVRLDHQTEGRFEQGQGVFPCE